jgi:ATP-dependent exoDNAse (exonuclease V) alpha subunit
MPVTIQHDPMLRRNLLYTGVTRGRRRLALLAPDLVEPILGG